MAGLPTLEKEDTASTMGSLTTAHTRVPASSMREALRTIWACVGCSLPSSSDSGSASSPSPSSSSPSSASMLWSLAPQQWPLGPRPCALQPHIPRSPWLPARGRGRGSK